MQKSKMIPKTAIEMGHYGWNIFEGHCPKKCWYCWSLTNKRRFKEPEPLWWNEERFWYRFPKNPSRILVCWTIDLFYPDIPDDSIRRIITRTKEAPHCSFLFLTKNPERYAEFDFPENCWLGVTVTGYKDISCLRKFVRGEYRKTNLLFLSYEPILAELLLSWEEWETLKWIILGALTGKKAKENQPIREWIEYFRFGARNWNIPLFMKNNLKKVWTKPLIQEFPERRTR